MVRKIIIMRFVGKGKGPKNRPQRCGRQAARGREQGGKSGEEREKGRKKQTVGAEKLMNPNKANR